MRFNQSGIAIGPILFIIAILAVLAAAIAAGSGSFTAGTSNEKAKTFSSSIMTQAGAIKNGVEKVLIGNSCTVNDLAFDSPGFSGDEKSGGTTASCNVYDITGGGVLPASLPTGAQDLTLAPSGFSIYAGMYMFEFNRGTGLAEVVPHMSGTNWMSGQLMLFAPYITHDVCVSLNQMCNANPPSYAPLSTTYSLMMGFHQDTNSGINGAADSGNLGPYSLSNSTTQCGCVQGNSSYTNNGAAYWQPDGSYHFYYILVPNRW